MRPHKLLHIQIARRRQRAGLVGPPVLARNRLPRQLLNRPQLVLVIRRAKRNRLARGPGPRGAANAVHIGLGHLRQIMLDHMGHAIHINAARRDIGRHQNGRRAALELVQRPLALGLALIAMDGIGRQTIGFEVLHNLIRAMLGAAEHQRPAHAWRPQQLGQHRPLATGFEVDNPLLHPLRRRRHRGHFHPGRVGQHFAGQLGNLRRHGGREEQRLPLTRGRRGAQNLADRRQKALIEHLVSLIEHHHLHMVQPGMPAVQMVLQAARRGDNNIHAARQIPDLRRMPHATKHGNDGKPHMLAIGLKTIGNLRGQFTRRAQHQAAHAAARRPAGAIGQLVQDGQRKGRRLARAGLGNAQDVAPGHGKRNRLRLNGGRGGIAGLLQRLQQAGVKAEFVECSHKFPCGARANTRGPFRLLRARMRPRMRKSPACRVPSG